MMEVFDCHKTQTNRYKLLLLKPCTKALSQSTKISLRMDHRGFLSLQCMILTEDKQVCFVEYLVSLTFPIKRDCTLPNSSSI